MAYFGFFKKNPKCSPSTRECQISTLSLAFARWWWAVVLSAHHQRANASPYKKSRQKGCKMFLWNHFSRKKKPAKKIIFRVFQIRTFFDSKWLTEQHYHKLFHNEWNILYYIWSRISHPELFHRLCHTFVHYEDRIFQRK